MTVANHTKPYGFDGYGQGQGSGNVGGGLSGGQSGGVDLKRGLSNMNFKQSRGDLFGNDEP